MGQQGGEFVGATYIHHFTTVLTPICSSQGILGAYILFAQKAKNSQ
jgi:hypothetical protein